MSEERVTFTVTIEFEADPQWHAQREGRILSEIAWSVASNQARVVSVARARPDGGTEPISMEDRGFQPGREGPSKEATP